MHVVKLYGPQDGKARIWRVLKLLQDPDEWEGDPPKVQLIWVHEDGREESA